MCGPHYESYGALISRDLSEKPHTTVAQRGASAGKETRENMGIFSVFVFLFLKPTTDKFHLRLPSSQVLGLPLQYTALSLHPCLDYAGNLHRRLS